MTDQLEPQDFRCPICTAREGDCEHSEDQMIAVLAARMEGRTEPTFLTDGIIVPRGKRKDKAVLNQEASDFQWLMRHEPGRRIVRGMLEAAGLFGNSYLSARLDGDGAAIGLHMAFLEGARNQGALLLAKVTKHAPDEYLTMMKEDTK